VNPRIGASRRFAVRALLGVGLALLCVGCGDEGADAGAYEVTCPLEIEITGSRFHWRVRYPGRDGRLHTADDPIGDGEVHVPVGTRTRLLLRSEDYVYTLALPHLGLKEIAVPDLDFQLDFDASQSGTFELRGDQMCGYAHADLIGKLVVGTAESYVAEMRRLASQ
jgi:heme/copper-type cytochrome/quinol oxidase subunit 2